MAFNKKILGSCCVGLALLLGGDCFGMQPEIELSGKKITKQQVVDAYKLFAGKKGFDLEDSYCDSYVVAYLATRSGMKVKGFSGASKPEDFLAEKVETMSCELVGGEEFDELYGYVQEVGSQMNESSAFDDLMSGADQPVYRGSGKYSEDEDEEPRVSKKRPNGGYGSDDESESEDAPFLMYGTSSEDFLAEAKKYVLQAKKKVEEFALDAGQKKLLSGESADMQRLLGDEFYAIYGFLYAHERFYEGDRVLPTADEALALRNEYIKLLGELAEAGKNNVDGISCTLCKPKMNAVQEVKIEINHAFRMAKNALNGVANVKGKKIDVTDVKNLSLFNKSTHEVYNKTTHSSYDLNTEDKYNKATQTVIDTKTQGSYDLNTEGKYNTTSEVKLQWKDVVALGQAVDGYQQAITNFKNGAAGAQLVADITGNQHKGTHNGLKAAMEGELDGLWPAVGVAEKIIGHNAPISDLASAQQFSQLVVDTAAGKWGNTTADEKVVNDQAVKQLIEGLKKEANGKSAANLLSQAVGSNVNEDSVRAQLLLAKLAGKTADDIKTIIDN